MAFVVPGPYHRPSVTASKVILILIFVAVGLLSPVAASFIRFKPDTEYQYNFQSSADLKEVVTLQAESKIGFVLVKTVSDGSDHQQVYLRVHSAAIAKEEEKVLLTEEKDFDGWFSFDVSANGVIGQVYYPRDEDDHVVATKKGLVNLLASNLQHPPDGQKNGWSYHSNETGHEGPHEASYTARMAPGNDGIIVFTKTRRTHPIPYGKSRHQKEIHYHPGMQLPTMVKILDHFDAPRKASQGFKDQYYKSGGDDNYVEFPEMKSFSEGQLTFIREMYYPSPTGPPDDEDLIADSLHTKKFPDRRRNFNVTEVKEFISGNLTCMRTAPLKGSNQRSHCFEELVDALHSLSDGHQLAETVAPMYKFPLSRRFHDREDRRNMLDAVSQLQTDTTQSLLTDLILLSPKPNKELVERLLTLSVGFKRTISAHYLETVEDIVFHPGKFPESLRDREIQRVAVLVLGALAGHLWEAGYKLQAEPIVVKIEDKLGVHDPWTYDKTLRSLTKNEQDEFHHDTVAWIEALGNAGLHRSFPHIQSYTNSSTTHTLLKRAGLHAMRDYHHDQAAGILLKFAMDEDEDEHVRYEASLLYRQHPNGGHQNVTKFVSPEKYAALNLSEAIPAVAASVPSRHRVRRGFWDGFQFKLPSPSIDWHKTLGGPEAGAKFGLTIRNDLEMKIALLNSYLRVDVLDEAYATVVIGLVNYQFDIVRARFCFRGHVEYNLNILQEFGVERLSDIAKIYDIIIGKVVGNIVRAVDVVVKLFNGDISISRLFDDFVQQLESIPDRISNMRSIGARAVARLSQFNPDKLPPSFRGIVNVINKAAQHFSDIKTDVMEFYQAVSEAVTVTLPRAADQIWKSINGISDSLGDLLSSPLTAIGKIFKGVLNVKMAIDSVLEAKMEVEKAAFFKEGQEPYWLDLPTVIGDTLKELTDQYGKITRDLNLWVDEVRGSSDPVKKLTGGATNSRTLRKRVKDEIESIFNDLMDPIRSIMDPLAPFFALRDLVFGTIQAAKEAYQTLKDAFQKSQALVMKLFGPKAHESFPRKYRKPGSGGCEGGGFYPTDSDGAYENQGVDLEINVGQRIVAPFSGAVFKSKHNQVTLVAKGGAFRNIEIYIDNIKPNSTISETGVDVVAGTEIGVAGQSTKCRPPNYIHVSMKNFKPNRLAAILDSFLDEKPSAADLASKEGYVDPSNYLLNRPMKIPRWIQECDDYKFVWLGETLKEGSLLGQNKEGEIDDTTPDRAPPPPTTTSRPNPSSRPPEQTLRFASAVSPGNKLKTKEALGLPDPKLGSGSLFKNFTLRNLKISSILAFAQALQLKETADELQTVVKTIVKLVGNKPCVLPESLTDEALRMELQQRGLSSQGDRKVLLKHYRQPDDRCPLLQVSLPKNVYCKIDESCLGVECCMNVKIVMVSLALKAFARFDPCEFQFVLGIDSWKYTLQILDAEFGREMDVPVPYEIPFVDEMELRLRYAIEKTKTKLLITLAIGVCPSNGDADCMLVTVMTDSQIPLPICHPDGTFTWPDIDIEEYFSRAALKKLFKNTGEEILQYGVTNAMTFVLNQLGIPKEFLRDKDLCPTPTSLTESQLIAELRKRQLRTTGTKTELARRLSDDDRACQFLTLPVFSPEVAKVAYCSLSENCLRMDCCLELNIQPFKFRRSFRAYIDVDACDYTLVIAFQHLRYRTLLLSYNWGQKERQVIGAITLTYSINKLEAQKMFEIDFGASACLDGEECFFNIDIIQGYRVPIPVCDSKFSLSLPGGDSLQEFITQVGQNAGEQAVNIFLEYIGLRDKIDNRSCDLSVLIPGDEDVCTDVSLPTMAGSVTCDLSERCLGIRCCIELDLKITVMSVSMWLILDPCEFKLSMGLGKWSLAFNIFNYHWGTQQQVKIGKALTLIYTIEKLTADKVFVLDLALSLCLPESACDTPSIDLFKGTRVPIPVCNDNATFTLPGDGTVAGFLQTVGQSAGETSVDAILYFLGLSDFISQVPCHRPQVTQNGWQRICPRDVRLPHLPKNLVCTLPEKCLGFDCCLELPIPGIRPISTRLSFIFDPCDFLLSLSLDSWSKDLQIFSYQWGQREDFAVGKPIILSTVIYKLDAEESFRINLDLSFCLDGDCTVTPVLSDTLIPIPLCNLNASFELPGDGSFAGFARELAGNVGEVAIRAGLRKLGIEEYVNLNRQCSMSVLAPSENKCPFLGLPAPSSLLTCSVDDGCLGLQCCASLDLVFTRLSTTVWALLDPCESRISFGLGSWSKNVTLSADIWGVGKTMDVGDDVHIVLNVDKLTEQKEFLIDVSVNLCIDDTCRPITLLQGAHVPILLCNPNATVALPGDGTIGGYLTELGGPITNAAVDIVLDHLGLKNFLSVGTTCHLPLVRTAKSDSCPVQFPDTLPVLSCSINNLCTSVHCCLNLDLTVIQISSKAWFELNPCDYTLSIGLEFWFFNASLFSYEWGRLEGFKIGNAIDVRFSIDKLDATKEYEVDLEFSLSIDGVITDFPVMTAKRIPIPLCNANLSLTLPGDNTVRGFLEVLGDNVGQSAIHLVLLKLSLQDVLMGTACELRRKISDCPMISLPFLENVIQCSIDDRCYGIQCCVHLDFVITSLMLSTSIQVDPCDFWIYLAFEKWERNFTLFSYTWGRVESLQIGNAITLSFSIDKLTAKEVFSVTMSIGLCIDGSCTVTTVLDHVWVPIPVCNMNMASFTLPGDGTVRGFVRELGGRTGSSAVDLVMRKFGLSQYLQSIPCNMGTPGTVISGCPSVSISHLPDFLSCSVTDSCLGIKCCLEMDLKITTRSVNAWVILDPCNFNLSVGFEKWKHSVTLFHYSLGDVMEEAVNDVLRVRWRVAKIADDKQFEIDLSLVFCVDGVCDTLTVFEGSRLPIPVCYTEVAYTVPGDGSVSGFLSYLGGNVGQFAVDAVLRHLNLTSFLSGKACFYQRQDVCFIVPGFVGKCSLIGETCTELRCCMDMDLRIANVSATVWFKFDPCDFTFTLGLEKWLFHGYVFSYQWGEEMTVSIASGIDLRFSIGKLDDTREFLLDMTLEYCVDELCTNIDLQHDIPIPACIPHFRNYTLSAGGFIETVTGQVIEGATLALLSRLGIDPEFFSSLSCVNPVGPQSFTNCPSMQLPHDLASLAHCGILNTCFGIQCCLDVNLGPINHAFSASMVIDPCLGQLTLQFGNWQYKKSISQPDFDTNKEIIIGNFVSLRFMLELMGSEISVTLTVDVCINGLCTGRIVLLDSAKSPLPHCFSNGTISWNTLPGLTSVSYLESLDVGFETVATALRLPPRLVSASPCPPVVLPRQSGACPHLPRLSTLSSGGVCHYSDACLGVVCCLTADLGVISRTMRAWLIVDPCDFGLSVGFENWSYNVTLLSYKWGKLTRERLSDAVSLAFTIDKTSDNRNLLLSVSVKLCIAGVCAPDVIMLEDFSAPIPLCYPNGTLELAKDLDGNIGDYASSLVVNLLRISTDTLLPLPCSAQPEQITPATSGCPSFSLPSSAAPYCSPDETCLGVRCCLSIDLGIVQRPFRLWVKLDPCSRNFSFGFEKWRYSEVLSIEPLQTHSNEKDIGVVKIRYAIQRPHTTVFDVDLEVSLCPEVVCKEPVVILQDTMISGSHCVDSGGGSRTRRRRRSVDDLTSESTEGVDNMEDLVVSSVDKARDYFKALLEGNNTATFSAKDNILAKLQPNKVVKPRLANSGTASRRSMGLLVLEDKDETPVTRRRRRDVKHSVTAGGASLFDLNLAPGADSGTWQGFSIIGGGLTLKGLNALGQRIADMTIGELEAMLDLQNIDPLTVVRLMKELRALFRTFVEELIDAVFAEQAGDMFQQFDIVISGTIPFPRIETTFFEFNWGTPIAGIIFLDFTIKGGGFFDMTIPVSFGLVSMKAKGGIVPTVGAYATARVAIGFVIYGEMELKADVLRTSFPTIAEIQFSKFPIGVGLRLDVVMIPLIMRLKARVTVKVLFTRKVLFSMDLWRYEAPAIHGNIFNIPSSEPDSSPPEISEYSTPVEDARVGRSAARTNKCGVEQVPGLDYTEPAFQLEIVAGDDKSLVTFTYQVGTSPGGSDVVSETEFGGPSAIISQTLLGGQPLHFTVYARNSGAGTSTATCSLPTFDITLPTGRITPDFTSTSHPYILRASAVVYDDSVILMQKEGVGFGVGIWGDQIVPWNTIDVTERQHLGSSDNEFHYFTAGKKGRLISTPISTIDHLNKNFCARDCLALPETICLSINYDFSDFTCELLQEIEGHGVEVHESGFFSHFERLGIGYAVEFNHETLQLDHNQIYFFNIELLNYVAYEKIISSVPIIADFTTPDPGLIVNATRDEEVHEPCVAFTPEEWERRCIEDTPLNNHRYITDGPGSMTVFNGYEKLVDTLYTRSNTFIAANWDGIHDKETGIFGYTWSIGYIACGENVSNHIDPHAHLFDESEWTHQGLVVNVNLPDGAYYITVRALNKVEFGGPMALSVCHSTPLIIDNTPPIIDSITDITYDSSIGRIAMTVNADDPESDLFEFHVAAGRTSRDISLRDWETLAVAEQIFLDFRIPNGIPCWIIVRVVNAVDLRTVDHADEPILVDDTPPISGNILDGPYPRRDLVFTKDRNEICANWYNWYDPESGIYSYLWAVGTKPGLSNIVDFVKVSHREHSACSGYVTLQHGETYYSTLTAFHGGNDKLNGSKSSDGVTVDLTPPVQGSIYDGLLAGPSDVVFSSTPATVAAQWEGYSDPESGIEDYQVTIYRKHDNSANATNDFEVIHKAESVGSETSSIEWHHFHLHHKDQVYVNLRTINQALNHIDTQTDGFLLDLTPPMLRNLGDGLVVGEDADFQVHTDSLAVHWDYFDDESGIESFELAIYEMRHARKHKIFPKDTNPNNFELISDATAKSYIHSGLSLRPGSIYITHIRARNQAKLVASYATSGIRVDPSPPMMRYVRSGNLDGEAEEIHNGYVYQNSRSTIQASWLGADGQSGIKSYWVAVGTAPNVEDIQPFISMGLKSSGVLTDIALQLTDGSTCSDERFTEDCRPVYYVCVKSENGAGAFSDVICSSPIRVVEKDQTGYVTDGPSILQDVDAQHERTTVTIWFNDFESKLHGISRYEWAVGTTPGGEEIQPLTSDGIVSGDDTEVQGLAGKGKAQSPLPLQHNVTYYSTVRAITNGDNILESVSNGFKVDVTPPKITITSLGQYDLNVDLSSAGGLRLYQANTDSIGGAWEVYEGESDVAATYFSMGRYPGGSSLYRVTETSKSYVPPALVTPVEKGLPLILAIRVINSVALETTVYGTSFTVDDTPPSVGQVQCPAFLHANSALLCSWSDFLDAESGIGHVRFLVGSAQGRSDVHQSDDLPGHSTHYSAKDLDLIHNKVYYATVEAFNAVNQSTLAFSDPIEIDDTPPSHGLVVELSGVHSLNLTDPKIPSDWNCTDEEKCSSMDGECLESITQLQILWQPFTDEDTQITKYEVALGTTPGGYQIKPFYEVSKDQTSELITNIDLSDVRKVYSTVRGYNEAGLTSAAVSNGIYVSHFSAGLQPLRPFQVKDGITEGELINMDFQTSLNELSAMWDFSGDPFPFKKYEWAIYRIDGLEIQPLADVGERTSGTNTDLEMTDGETYFTVVRATNALGLTATVRSDGITVKRDPLIPGQVYDGLLVGFDLTFQKMTDTISANWNGFGKGLPAKNIVRHTGNAEITEDETTDQTVDYYEAAVGTDHRYPKTRENVVPFTYVGQNTTVTFTNLGLTALSSTYYVTVRAHSASLSAAEVTSNGISIGVDSTVLATDVEISEYVNSLSEVQLQWDEFESTVPILLYYVGLGKPSPSTVLPSEMDCLDMLLETQQAQAIFTERQMHFVGKDTYVKITGLNLTHEGSYYVTVVGMNEGGQCNSSIGYFSVDITPPIEGRLRAGPFYEMPVMYTESRDSILVVWEDYSDNESGIKSFNLRVLEAATCNAEDSANLTVVPNQDWLILGPDISQFNLVDLSLVTSHPYFVQLVALNRAGGSTQTKVGPIFMDSSEPTAGFVADGLDFKMDITDSGDRHQVSGTILNLPTPEGPPCPLRGILFTDSEWSGLNFSGLWNMNKENWDLVYTAEQVVASDESLTLTIERDTRGPRMLSGAYVINAQIIRSSEYEFDLIAAPPDLQSVTSILFWDGPDGFIGEFDFGGRENWQDGICQCCYAQPFNQSTCPQCDCEEFLGMLLTTDGNSSFVSDMSESSIKPSTTSEFTTSETNTTQPTQAKPQLTTNPNHWTIQKADEDGKSVSDEQRGSTAHRACGFQLYPNVESSQAVLWCRYLDNEWPMTSQVIDLDFDPSTEEHHYFVRFKVTPFYADEDEWSFEVYVDGKLLSSLTGIPALSPSTKLILHVFNRDSYVAHLEDPFNPPAVTVTFRNFRMPPDQSELCRYGEPFRAGTSPVSRYFAGIGTKRGLTDVVAYEEIGRPCVPCVSACDRYQCDPSCSVEAVPITFTLTNFSLPRLELLNMTSSNDTNSTTSAAREDGLVDPFFLTEPTANTSPLTVKSFLGNGKSVIASSNGFYVDDTPAELDVFFYTDINFGEFEPTSYQSSDSTIKVIWSFIDIQSKIKEHHWAIGTSKGLTDLQDFVNVGLNQTGINSNLTGLLHHNTTYYVTLRVINGAGLEALVECDGVTVLLEKPAADGVNTTLLFSEKFEEEVYPPDSEKTSDPKTTGTSWTKGEDKSVARYEYCVSSSAELIDDIIPCMVVGSNASGSVAIEGGEIILRAGDMEERYSITDFQMPKNATAISDKPAKFNMEPGKCLHTWMKICNAAKLCVTEYAGTTTVLGESDMLATSSDGTDLTLTSPAVKRRRRRAVNDHFDLTVATTGGLHKGSSLIMGLLDVNRASEEYTSDAPLSYKPYITNPLYTIQYTSRLLRQRIRFIYEPTFYITSLGQIELRGPVTVTVSLRTPGNWTEAKPRLIYWNTADSQWQDAARTCYNEDRITYREEGNQFTVAVCDTRSSLTASLEASRKTRAVEEEPLATNVTYFSHETHFAVVEVLDAAPNNPPEITNLVGKMFMNEDEGTLVYTFLASDPEDDNLVFELVLDEGARGKANITRDGTFSFTPCADCHGAYTLLITVREMQIFDEIEQLSTNVSVDIEVRPVNDNPVLFIAQNGQVVGNGRTALLTVEQNTGSNVAYKSLIAELGAYDVDVGDNLSFMTQPPTYGTLTLTNTLRTVPSTQYCGASSRKGSEPDIPCGLKLPQNREDMSWITSTFTYAPNPNYHGEDSFRVLVEDQSGAVSQLLVVRIAVLVNPCINNGICRGPVEDPDCTSPARSNGFESYVCACEPGWVGDFCETDYDECQSTPCEYPYVCHNQLNGFECACPLSNPVCDGLNWRMKVIILVVCTLVGLLIIAAVVFYFYKKKCTKVWHLQAQFDDSKSPSQVKRHDDSQQTIFNPVYDATNVTLADGSNEGKDQPSTSAAGCPTPERPQSTVSAGSDGSSDCCSSEGSRGSSKSKRSGERKLFKSFSGPHRSNAVADAPSLEKDSPRRRTEIPEPPLPGSAGPSNSPASPAISAKRAESTMPIESTKNLENDREVHQQKASPADSPGSIGPSGSPGNLAEFNQRSGSPRNDSNTGQEGSRLLFQQEFPPSDKKIQPPEAPLVIKDRRHSDSDGIEESAM